MRDYKVDLCYTPMILAKEFVRSNFARNSDFTTYGTPSTSTIPADTPLIVQFGASNALDFARAAEMVAPYCDGVNLNCGCPQSWAISEGVGCALMRKPELVAEMVREAKKRTGNGFCVSVKMRIHADLEETKRYVGDIVLDEPGRILEADIMAGGFKSWKRQVQITSQYTAEHGI
jgi:tRNA-dihydrouridine synthase 4